MTYRSAQSLSWLALALALTACSDDDPTSPETPTNADPAAVDLTMPADGTAGVDGALTLRWNASTDPDGDEVSYTVYLDENADPITEVASDIDATSYEINSAWPLDTTYYWKVIASDGEGGESTSPVRSFSTRGNTPPDMFALTGIDNAATGIAATPTLSWEAATDPDGDPVVYDVYLDQSANPATRVATDIAALEHAVITSLDVEEQYYWKIIAKDDRGGERASETRQFTTRDRLWVISGSNDSGSFEVPDVWSSSDGVTWERAAEDAGYRAMAQHASVVFDDKMWIIGGGGGNGSSDVWSDVYALEH